LEDQIINDVSVVSLFYAKYVYLRPKKVSNVTIDINQIEPRDVQAAQHHGTELNGTDRSSRKVIELRDLSLSDQLAVVPEFDRFATVDELAAATRQLAADHPGQTRLRRIGSSRLGEPLHSLTIDGGDRDAVVFALPHPNEPVGGLTAVQLATALCRDEGLREVLGYRWHIVPCIDPDGTRLNEGWFAGPMTRGHYARNFYRPALDEQVEWTFPVTYKRHHFDRVLPETAALMGLIDETTPALLVSLHNSETGGVYYYLSRPQPTLYATLHAIPRSLGLPLDVGEPEAPYIPVLAPAIYQMVRCQDEYEFVERTGGDPASGAAGTSSAEYAQRHGTLSMVCEAPQWVDARARDDSPSDLAYADVLYEQADALAELAETLEDALRAVSGDLLADSPYLRASRSFAGRIGALPGELLHRAKEEASQRLATVAECWSCADLVHLHRLRLGGMLLRTLDGELGIGNATAAIRRTRASFTARYDAWVAEAERATPPVPAEIRRLVATQLGAIIATATHLA